jgi:hypothetical protein
MNKRQLEVKREVKREVEREVKREDHKRAKREKRVKRIDNERKDYLEKIISDCTRTLLSPQSVKEKKIYTVASALK